MYPGTCKLHVGVKAPGTPIYVCMYLCVCFHVSDEKKNWMGRRQMHIHNLHSKKKGRVEEGEKERNGVRMLTANEAAERQHPQ
jgi:hypothetical protein